MKKILIFLLTLMPLSILGQDDMYSYTTKKPKVKIITDKTDSKGQRFLFTKTKVFANTKDEGYFSFCAGAINYLLNKSNH